jgi:hypothetical protein
MYPLLEEFQPGTLRFMMQARERRQERRFDQLARGVLP